MVGMVNKNDLFESNGSWTERKDPPAYPMAGGHGYTRRTPGGSPPDIEECAGACEAESLTANDPAGGWVTQARHGCGGSSLPVISLQSFNQELYPATHDDTSSYGDTSFYPQNDDRRTAAASDVQDG